MENLKRGALSLVVALMFSGCSVVPKESTERAVKADQLVSLDLVNVLYQVQSLNPISTVLVMPQALEVDDQFSQSLLTALQQAGYAIRTSGDNAKAQAVSYSVSRQVDVNSGSVMTYTVNVGEISVRRAYRPENDGWISPVAAMQIRGADANQLSLNDDIFKRSADSSHKNKELPASQQAPTPEEGELPAQPAAPSEPIPEIPSTPTDTIVSLPAPVTEIDQQVPSSASADPLPESAQVLATVEAEDIPLRQRAPSSAAGENLLNIVAPTLPHADTVSNRFGNVGELDAGATGNIRHLGESNYANILNSLGTVKETILTFTNDSTRLGSSNKERVQQFVAQFNPQSDVFSVIGCSHGNTNYQGGQQALAMGRAQRVKEELQFSGVPDDKILDEGCWAPEQFDKRMPRRGVVLSLKRRG